MRQNPRPRESEIRTTVTRDLKTDLLRSIRDLYDLAYLKNAKNVKRELVQRLKRPHVSAIGTQYIAKQDLMQRKQRPNKDTKDLMQRKKRPNVIAKET